MIVEAVGNGLPLVAVPFTNRGMAAHPAFGESIEKLRRWGVTVLWGPDVMPEFPPGGGDEYVDIFPWDLAVQEIRIRLYPE